MILTEIEGLENETYRPFLPEDLIRAWIDEDILIFGAEENEKPVGACAFLLLPDRSAKILHLYLKEEERGKGLGEEMFDLLVGELLRLEVETVRLTTFPGENPALDQILSAYEPDGYESQKTYFSFRVSEIQSTLLEEQSVSAAKSLEEATPAEMESLSKTLLSSKDCPVMPDLTAENADPSMSFLYTEESAVKGALFAETKEEEVLVSFLYSTGKRTDALFDLLSAFSDAVRKRFSPQTRITFVTIEDRMTMFFRKILNISGKTATELLFSLLPIRDFEDEDESEEFDEEEMEEMAV